MVPMGFGWAPTWKSDIPVSVVSLLPGAFKDDAEAIYFMKDFGFEKLMRNDVGKHNVLWFPDHTSPQELVSKKPIKSLSDLKGIKVRSYGVINKYFEALGASATWIASPEIYTEHRHGSC